jgi:hypothetical protein
MRFGEGTFKGCFVLDFNLVSRVVYETLLTFSLKKALTNQRA